MAGTKYCTSVKNNVIKEFQGGMSQKNICEKFCMPRSTVSYVINKFKNTKTVETIHRGGRPKCTTTREDARIVREFRKDPYKSASRVIESLNLKLSLRTVQRRAVAGGLKSYRAAKKPFISQKNRKARLKFAREHLTWTVEQWNSVLFSDESKFNFVDSDGMKRVRRPANNRLNPQYCTGTVKHGGGHVMVWGCFSGESLGPLHKINGIMDKNMYKNILQEIMLPHANEKMPTPWIFQHDNDPKHTSKLVKSYLEQEGVTVLPWPAQSPDLNPIENLWEIVNKKVNREAVHRDPTKLYQAINDAWSDIPMSTVESLISSMPRRCAAVLKNSGYATKY